MIKRLDSGYGKKVLCKQDLSIRLKNLLVQTHPGPFLAFQSKRCQGSAGLASMYKQWSVVA